MKKLFYTLLFCAFMIFPSFAQNDPGFGGEGDGDAQTSPTSPVEIPIPIIASIPVTCATSATSTIINYDDIYFYTFSPATSGITISSTGLISGLIEGMSYVVVATDGFYSSLPSIAFSNSVSVSTPAPTANGIQVFCNTALPTVANLTATGTNIQWYGTSTGGSPIASTEPLADETYYATQIVNGCESTTRTAVMVRFNDPQITASETTVCSGTQVSLTASTTALINNSGLPTNLQNGLVGYWPFNGNANDESGNGNNGTVNGASLTTDRFGNMDTAYQFNANQENFISITTNGATRNVTTMSCWIKFDGPIGGGLPSQSLDWYSIVDGFLLNGYSIDSRYKKIIFNYNNQPTSSSQIIFNEWNHIVITIDLNGLCTFIFNGNFAGSQSIIGNYSIFPSIINSNSNISFVGKSSNNAWYFNGKIDNLAIYNKVLTLSEITQLYNAGQTTYLWSTGETTATINPTPTATTTYWCDLTLNGITCRKEITISVYSNTYYADADGDGFGSGAPVLLCSPTPPTGYATNNSDCNDGLSTLTTSCVVTLPLKVMIQGYYKGSGQMTPVRKNAGLSNSNDEVDEVTVALYSPSNVNQAVATTTVVLATNGTATAEFDATLLTESQYYIGLQHKNTIKTWSAIPVAITNYTTYDFTTTASQAYGNNQIEVAPGIYAIYSGDMNQDGTINEADLPIFTTANTTAAHGYVVSDLNGDGSVDLLDYPIYKNNADIIVVEKRPIVTATLTNVTIGTQVWQSTNLEVTTYSDGTPIPQVSDPAAWANLTTGAWCYYNNDPANGAIYGKLYNWYAVAGIHDNDPNTPNKILAPEGWHVPTDAEWSTLVAFLGGGSVAGGKMKASNETLWASPNIGATNTSGFFGLPGGWRNELTQYGNITGYAMWWSFSEHDNSYALNRFLDYTNTQVFRDLYKKSVGFSVRCIKD